MPKPTKPGRPKPLYRRRPPKPQERGSLSPPPHLKLADSSVCAPARDVAHYHTLAPSHFTPRDDGGIEVVDAAPAREQPGSDSPSLPRLEFRNDERGLWLYHGNSLELLNDIAWEKPNPRPNLSCRYFTHSTETIL